MKRHTHSSCCHGRTAIAALVFVVTAVSGPLAAAASVQRVSEAPHGECFQTFDATRLMNLTEGDEALDGSASQVTIPKRCLQSEGSTASGTAIAYSFRLLNFNATQSCPGKDQAESDNSIEVDAAAPEDGAGQGAVDFDCRVFEFVDNTGKRILRCVEKDGKIERRGAENVTEDERYEEIAKGMKVDFELDGGSHCRIHLSPQRQCFLFGATGPAQSKELAVGVGLCETYGYTRQVVVLRNPYGELVEGGVQLLPPADSAIPLPPPPGTAPAAQPVSNATKSPLTRLGFHVSSSYVYTPNVEHLTMGFKFGKYPDEINNDMSLAGVHSVSEFTTASWLGLPVDPLYHYRVFRDALDFFAKLRFRPRWSESLTRSLSDVFAPTDQPETQGEWTGCEMTSLVLDCVAAIHKRLEDGLTSQKAHDAAIHAVYWRVLSVDLTPMRLRFRNAVRSKGNKNGTSTDNELNVDGYQFRKDSLDHLKRSLYLPSYGRLRGTIFDDHLDHLYYKIMRIEKTLNNTSDFDVIEEHKRDDRPFRVSKLRYGLWKLLNSQIADEMSQEELQSQTEEPTAEDEKRRIAKEVYRSAPMFVDPIRSEVLWEEGFRMHGHENLFALVLNTWGKVFIRNSDSATRDELHPWGTMASYGERIKHSFRHHRDKIEVGEHVGADVRGGELRSIAPHSTGAAHSGEKKSGNSRCAFAVPAGNDTYSLNEVLAAVKTKGPICDAETRRDTFFSNYFGAKNETGEFAFSVTDIPFADRARGQQQGSQKLGTLRFKCSSDGVSPMSTARHIRSTNYTCEGMFLGKMFMNNWSSDMHKLARLGHFSTGPAFSLQFERNEPHGCFLGYLGDVRSFTRTSFSSTLLAKIAIGLTVIQGFPALEMRDTATDVNTFSRMMHLSSMEDGHTFARSAGFELSGKNILNRQSNQTCSGIGFEHDGNVPAVCSAPSSFLNVEDAFDREEANRFARLAEQTLFNLHFNCSDPIWKNCDQAYSSMTFTSDGGCGFETEPEYRYLSTKFPESCGLGERVGECHRKVRQEIPCRRKELPLGKHANLLGCHLAQWIELKILRPDDPQGKLQEHMNAVSGEIAEMASSIIFKRVEFAEKMGAHQMIRSSDFGINELHSDPFFGQQQRVAAVKMAASLLKSSTMFIVTSGMPVFWKRLLGQNEHEDDGICKPAWAWKFLDQAASSYIRSNS